MASSSSSAAASMSSMASSAAMPSTSSASSSTRTAASSSLAHADAVPAPVPAPGRVDDADASSLPAPADAAPAPAPAPGRVDDAASSSSPAPADAAPAPGRVDDVAFPRLGTAPPRPPRGGRAAPPPPPLRGREARRHGGKTPRFTFNRDTITLSLGSLYGSAPGTAATAEAAGPTVGTAEAVDAPSGNTSAGDAEPGTTPPSGVAQGRVAAESAVAPGAPTLPAVQAFAFRDLFEQLRSSWSPPPPQLQGPPYRDLVPLQGPLQPPPLQAASYRDVVPLQGPPPQFAPPGHAHYARAMQFAARPQHMRFHLYAPGRPRLFLDVLWHFQATPPGHPQGPTRLLPLPGHPQGALQRAYPPLPRFGHAGSLCWDCQVRPAATPFPCGHFILCRECVARRLRCPCCTFFPQPGVPF